MASATPVLAGPHEQGLDFLPVKRRRLMTFLGRTYPDNDTYIQGINTWPRERAQAELANVMIHPALRPKASSFQRKYARGIVSATQTGTTSILCGKSKFLSFN